MEGECVRKLKRTNICHENRKILTNYYQKKGMNSKSKVYQKLHLEAAAETGLSQKTVLDWIGNQNRHNEKTYPHKKMYKKGVSAFNLFVKDNKETLQSMPLWGKAWNELSDDEKLGYKEKAKVACPVNSKEGLIKQIASLITELSNEHEIDLVCVGHDRHCQKQYLFGEGNPLTFTSNAKDFLSNLYTDCCAGGDVVNLKNNEEMSEYRQRAQDHINMLYGLSIGTKGAFPYKSYREGKVAIDGLPKDITPLKPPSQYGLKKLRTILSLKALNVRITNDDPQTATVTGNGYRSSFSVHQ